MPVTIPKLMLNLPDSFYRANGAERAEQLQDLEMLHGGLDQTVSHVPPALCQLV